MLFIGCRREIGIFMISTHAAETIYCKGAWSTNYPVWNCSDVSASPKETDNVQTKWRTNGQTDKLSALPQCNWWTDIWTPVMFCWLIIRLTHYYMYLFIRTLTTKNRNINKTYKPYTSYTGTLLSRTSNISHKKHTLVSTTTSHISHLTQ